MPWKRPIRSATSAPVWRLTPLAPPAMADLLARRGHQPIERSLLQVCPLHPGFAASPDVSIHPAPPPAWIEAFCLYSPVRPEHRDTMRRMLAAIAAPAGFAFVEEAGQPLAMAIGAVEGDHMGLFDVLVMPHARRRGLARKVTESLYAWAWSHGARFAYCRSSPPTKQRCRSTPRKVSAPCTITSTSSRLDPQAASLNS